MTTSVSNREKVKDPNAKLDFGVDWADPNAEGGPWLKDGETIETSTWTVPTGLTGSDDSHTDTKTTIWLAGGEAGIAYEVTNHIVTNAGREDDRSLRIEVAER